MYRTSAFAPFFAFALTTAVGPSVAHATSGLSDSETSYKGAIMLRGGVDASFAYLGEGSFNRFHYTQSEYAYWSGNTLYAGAEDEKGNGVDAIIEFFWFESSLDRGSDFYVAVIKARTTPKVSGRWYLETDGTTPTLHVGAYTDIGRQTGAFRWDWSVPFENYGIDSYGQVNIASSYGASVNAEGSAMYATKYEESGAVAEGSVQAKGYLNADYSVQTNYSVELWSWYTRVRGAPNQMTWDLTCGNFTKDEESAYHEYFLVMQSQEGVPFVLDDLVIGATVDQWWWGVWNQFSVDVGDIVLKRPSFHPIDDTSNGGDDDDASDDEEVFDTDTGDAWVEDDDAWEDPADEDLDDALVDDDELRGCSTVPGGAGGLGGLLLPLIALARRRR